MNFRKREVGTQAASLQALAELVQSGIEHPYVRGTALKIVRDCANRDDDCELGALFNAVRDGDEAVEALRKGFPYRADPKTIDWFSSADRILKMCEHGACGGDCLPYDTLVLRHDYRLVPLAEIYPGDSIMGDGAWTTVTNRWDKDEKDLLAITLANGSVLRVTEDHRLFRVPKTRAGYAGPRDAAEEVRAGDLRPDDDLLTIERIPFGVESLGRAQDAKPPHARVRSIASAGSAPVMDIETDSHRFYLPETDLVVHNCDEHAVLLASLAGSLGFTTGLRAFGPDPKKDRFTHVYAVALTPKKAVVPPGADSMGYGDFSAMKRSVVGLDTTVDRAYPGWQPQGGRYKTAWVLPPKGGV